MEEKEILKQVADLTIGRKIKDIVVPVKLSLVKRLANYILPEKYKFKPFKVYELFEPVTGNMVRIASVAVGLPDEIKGDSLFEVALPLINKHHSDIVYAIASGIHNQKEEPPQSLIDALTWNMTYSDLYEVLNLILNNANMQAFMNSTILIKGTDNILVPKIGPTEGSEIIAFHNQ